MASSSPETPSYMRDTRTRTIAWGYQRTLSTAFAKCLSFIDDTEVWFEPYCYSYVARSEYKSKFDADLPLKYEGNEEEFEKAKQIMDGLTNASHVPKRLAYASVKRSLEGSSARHVFVKDMGWAVNKELYKYIPNGYKHTFIIRNPLSALYSYRKAIYKHFFTLGMLRGEAADEGTYDLERDDVLFLPGAFVREVYDLWMYVKENIDSNPVVIDADDLQRKPKETLSAYCAAVGLPYNDGLLQWDASSDCFKRMKASGDDLLLKHVHFFGTAMKSTHFLPPKELPPRDQIPPDVIRCSERVMKYFDEMYKTKIKI